MNIAIEVPTFILCLAAISALLFIASAILVYRLNRHTDEAIEPDEHRDAYNRVDEHLAQIVRPYPGELP